MHIRASIVVAAVLAGACGPSVPQNFTEIQGEVFDKSCTFSVCHTGRNAAADLDLTAGNSYDSLVNVASGEVPSKLRVAAGDPAASYLLDKLLGRDLPAMCPDTFFATDATACSTQMPRDGEQLDDAYIEGITAWIEAGAAE